MKQSLALVVLVLAVAAPAQAHVPYADELVKLAEQRYDHGCTSTGVHQGLGERGDHAFAWSFREEGRCHMYLPDDAELHGEWSLYELCSSVVHEVGHWATGPEHSPDPSDPMHGNRAARSVPECDRIDQLVGEWRAHRALVRASERRALRRYRACHRSYRYCIRRASRSCGKYRRMSCWRFIAKRV